MGSTNSDWQTIVAAKQKKSQSLIPEAWKIPESITKELKYPLEENANRILDLDIPKRSGILSEREVEITESNTVAQLLSKLASGAYTSLEVTTAFCKRAAIAQQLVRIKVSSLLSPSHCPLMPESQNGRVQREELHWCDPNLPTEHGTYADLRLSNLLGFMSHRDLFRPGNCPCQRIGPSQG